MRHRNPSKFRVSCAVVALGGALIAQLSAASAQTSTPLFGLPVQPGRTLQLSDMTTNQPLIPEDIYRNGNNTVAHRDLATFAWLEFIAAVAPYAGGKQRGLPGGSFDLSGRGTQDALVWETYQHRTELFPCTPSGPVKPQPWGQTPTYTVVNSAGQCVTLLSGGGVPFNNLDEASQIGQNFLFFPTDPAKPNPNVDAQVLFEAKANQVESDFFTNTQSSPITLPNGTVEVKAAWRPLRLIPPHQQHRYHTAQVVIYAGTEDKPSPRIDTYALVALHIIHKTQNYSSFIFATFEQVDDYLNQAPLSGETVPNGPAPTGVYYVPTYSSIAYTTPPTTTFPPTNTTVSNPTITLPNGTTFNPQTPQAAPYASAPPIPLPVGPVAQQPGAKPFSGSWVTVPVTAPVSTVPDVAEVNNQAVALMRQLTGFGPNFVWQYYKLTGVQAIPTNDETTPDFYLANIVVESSQPGIQLFRGFPTIDKMTGVLTNVRNQVNVVDGHVQIVTSGGGCQGCHGVAQTQFGSDFSFLVSSRDGRHFAPDVLGLPKTATALAAHLAKRDYLK